MPTTTRDPDVRRIADEAVRRTKGYARREHPNRNDYDAIIDAIKTRLEI